MLDNSERRFDRVMIEVEELKTELAKLRDDFDALLKYLDEDTRPPKAGSFLSPVTRKNVQPIELTGKRHKSRMLLGAGMAIVGTTVGFLCAAAGVAEVGAAAFVFAFLGVVIFLVARILAWWDHG